MENPFRYSFNEKRYHTYNYYLKTRYGCKVSKVILDAGFTCPNRDGTKAYGGCVFCSARGSGDSNSYSSDDLLVQYQKKQTPWVSAFLSMSSYFILLPYCLFCMKSSLKNRILASRIFFLIQKS